MFACKCTCFSFQTNLRTFATNIEAGNLGRITRRVLVFHKPLEHRITRNIRRDNLWPYRHGVAVVYFRHGVRV